MPFERTAGGDVTGYTVQTPKFDPDKECPEDDPFPWIKVGTLWLVEIYDKVAGLRMSHMVCDEDCWYSCPKSGECCNDAEDPNVCRCAADAHNAKVDAILESIEYG